MSPHEALMRIIGKAIVFMRNGNAKPVGFYVETASEEEKEALKKLKSIDVENVRFPYR